MEHIHAHPITILGNLWRVLYLVIIPVVRGFVSALQGGFTKWVSGAWIDILILLLMVGIAVWRWYSITYSFGPHRLHISSGIIYRKSTFIRWDRIITMSVYNGFFLKPFRAVSLRTDTLGGSFKDADFSVFLTPTHADQVMEWLRGHQDPAPKEYDYTPKTHSILALALLTSNSFAGIVFIATFISQAGKLLGNEFADMLIGTLEDMSRRVAFGIPPAAAMLAYMLLLGWLIAFILTFIRYKNMLVTRQPHTLQITGGLFSQREYTLDYNSINFIDIRQSLTTKCLRFYSLYISVVGYGKQKDDISCIVPTEDHKAFVAARQLLFPAFSPVPRQHRPSKMGFMRFISAPMYPCLGIPVAMVLTVWRFPNWTSFIAFVGLMLMVPSLMFLVVRIIDFHTSGLAKEQGYYTLRYSRGFNLHTVVIPEQAVVLAELRQGFFQRLGGSCDLILHTKAEGRTVHRCRNVNMDEMQKLFHCV